MTAPIVGTCAMCGEVKRTYSSYMRNGIPAYRPHNCIAALRQRLAAVTMDRDSLREKLTAATHRCDDLLNDPGTGEIFK